MRIRRRWAIPVLGLVAFSGCTDEIPTSEGGGDIPVDAVSYELHLPFESFGRDFQVFGGFGTQADLPGAVVAHEWQGELEARTLIRFGGLPATVDARPPDGEEDETEASEYVPVSGQVVIRFDPDRVEGGSLFELEGGSTQTDWHRRSASWEMAVDTIGDRRPWPEPGGGPVRPAGVELWDSAEGDSVIFAVDSVTVAEWEDLNRDDRGFLLRSLTEGSRLHIADAQLRVQVRPTIDPDTLIEVSTTERELTFIYSPDPPLSTSAFQIGGAPSRRATFRIVLPETLEGDEELCALVTCPVPINADLLVYAGLELRTRESENPGFQPFDSIAVDIRPALSPDRLPRSPLGPPILADAEVLSPELFQGEPGVVEIPMTRYVRDLFRGENPQTGDPVPSTLAILTEFEPWDLEFGTFQGPGTEGAPSLRLIFTLSDGVRLP